MFKHKIELCFKKQNVKKFELVRLFFRNTLNSSIVELRCLDCHSKPTQHSFQTVKLKLKAGKCLTCSRKTDEVRALAEIKSNLSDMGCSLDSGSYKDQDSVFTIKCSKSHIFESTYRMIRRKTFSCETCKISTPALMTDFFLKYVADRGGEILTENPLRWRGARFRWSIKCKNPTHPIFPLDYAHARQRDQWCPKCGSVNVGENIVRDIFTYLFKAPFPTVKPEWLISPITRSRLMELDGYNASLRIAFEHTGGQRYGKDRGLMQLGPVDELNFIVKLFEKEFLCRERGVLLIEISEVDFRRDLKLLASEIASECEANGKTIRNKPFGYEPNFDLIYDQERQKKIGECLSRVMSLVESGEIRSQSELRRTHPKDYNKLKYLKLLNSAFAKVPNFGKNKVSLSEK